jgi:membrane associated rhomboid family serine protease
MSARVKTESDGSPWRPPELQLTVPRVLRIYWLIMWRSAVGGFLLGALAGAIVGVAKVVFGVHHNVTGYNALVGLFVGTVWGPFVVRMALRKRYRRFRLALISIEQPE